MKSIEKLLIDFIKSKTGFNATESTILFDDLGINGLDAELFMEELAVTFNVDLSDFNPNDYFLSEYELGNIFLMTYRLIFNRKMLRKKSISFLHLCNVIEKNNGYHL